jgi:cysteine-rich repeat protein
MADPDVGGQGPGGSQIGIAGALVAFIVPEVQQGRVTGDADACDLALDVYDADTNTLGRPHDSTGPLPVYDFVVGDGAVAFRVTEDDQCSRDNGSGGCLLSFGCGSSDVCDLNDDNDCIDRILFGYQLQVPNEPPGTDRVVNSAFQASRCDSPACDPRRPYRIVTGRACRGGTHPDTSCAVNADCGTSPDALCVSVAGVKFLTSECDQGCTGVCSGGDTPGADCWNNASCPGGGTCDFSDEPQCLRYPFNPCSEEGGVHCEFTECNGQSDSHGVDMNGDEDLRDIIVQIVDFETGTVTPLGVAGQVVQTADDQFGDLTDPLDTFLGRGRCALGTSSSPTPCNPASCAAGADCEGSPGRCILQSPSTCMASVFDTAGVAQCPSGSFCDLSRAVAVAPADVDGDLVPDTIDNCPFVNNPDQANRDSDNVGDACESCPNGAREGDEECDDGNTVDGDGCTADCRVEAGHYRLYRARETAGAAAPFVPQTGVAGGPLRIRHYDGPALRSRRRAARRRPCGRRRSQRVPDVLRAALARSACEFPADDQGAKHRGRIRRQRDRPAVALHSVDEERRAIAPAVGSIQVLQGSCVAPCSAPFDLADEIKSGPVTAVGMTSLCAPVNTGGGVGQPSVLLACYKTKGVASQTMASSSQDVTMANQFGAQPITIYSKRRLEAQFASSPAREQMCVPAYVVP